MGLLLRRPAPCIAAILLLQAVVLACSATPSSATDSCLSSGCHCGARCGSCWCDTPARCAQFGNCCPDHLKACGPAPPPPPPPPPPPSPGPGKPGHVQWVFDAGPGSSGGSVDNAAAVLGDGNVFFMSAHGNGSTFTLWALDAKTGARAWSHTPHFGNGTAASASAPAFGGGAVYYAVQDPTSPAAFSLTLALDAATGAVRWQRKLRGAPAGPPAVAPEGDTVFFGLGGGLFAVDTVSGDVRWNATSGSVAPATGPAVGSGGGMVAVASARGSIITFDAETGSQRWEAKGASNGWASPVFSGKGTPGGGMVFTAAGTNLTALDARTGKQRWTVDTGMYNPLNPRLDGGVLFIAGTTSTLFAYDAATGAPLWQAAGLCSVHLWDVPAVGKEHVYIGSDTDMQLIALEKRTGARAWNYTASNAVRSPTVGEGLVYFGVNSPWGPGSPDQLFALVT